MLSKLTAKNLRCHEAVTLENLSSLNLLLGSNGQGKTTLLEAAYLLARCRSFRTASPREMVKWETHGFRVEGDFAQEEFSHLALSWAAGKKTFEIDGITNATLSEFWGKCAAVIFQNRDLELVQDTSLTRRQWVDGLIASADPNYLPLLQRFTRFLSERKALLRQPTPERAMWDALTEPFIEISQQVTEMRECFSTILHPLVQSCLATLTPQHEEVELVYDPAFSQEKLPDWDEWFEREVRLGTTVIGPHKDDWVILLDGKPIRSYGSEGQQRSVALALRFAELLLLCKRRAHPPLVLIDDVFHELDETRIKAFWSLIPANTQIILATTRTDFPLPAASPAAWQVERNSLRRDS